MKYRIYQSQDFPALKNDRPRDYAMVYAGDIDSNPATSPLDTPVQVLEDIFTLHNMDDRPDAHRIRSLSVTDVVSLLDTDGTETFYMVASVGFERLLSCRVARIVDDTATTGDTITVWPPAGLDGVHLAVTPKESLSRKRTYNNTFEVPIQDVIAALVETRRIPDQSDGYEKAELVVRHNSIAVFAQPTDAAEKDYPGMNIDGADARGNQIFLANVEPPNADYPDSITSRLYNGYADFESDEPAALMRTRLREPEETARLGKYADEKQAFRKILYVDRDICETRTWGSDTSDEHEYEPPEDATPGQKKTDAMYHIITDLETRFKSLKDVLVPKVLFPSVPVTAAPGEDISTPRVVAAKTIEQCITAIGVLGRFRRCLAGNESCKSYAETLDEAYPVLVLELPDKSAFFKWISPSTDQVPDVKKTHEKWSMVPVPVVRGEIRWLGPYSLKINEDTCVCRKATFLDGPEGKDRPWINGRGHPLDSGQMDYEPWPGNTPKRNSSLDMFLFRENHTRLRLPVYVVPDGNAYATCWPSGLYPKKENQIRFPIRIPVEKLRPFTGFYDKNGEPLFLDDPVRTDGNDQCVVLGMPEGPALCLYGRPKIPFLYELPREDMRLRNVSLALDKI